MFHEPRKEFNTLLLIKAKTCHIKPTHNRRDVDNSMRYHI